MQHNADLEAESMRGTFPRRARSTLLAIGLIVSLAALATGPALGADTPTEIALTIEQHRFQPEEIRVKAGAPVVLVITNKDATSEEFESKDLRLEKVIPGGKTIRLRLPALKTGTYGFVGEYHEETAKGRIVAE
jgi:plastocyanin